MQAIIYPVALVTILGAVLGIVLALASKFMAVEVDETVEKLQEVLPGANCGACGFAGCPAYAAALAEGAPTNLCTPGGKNTAIAISEILGLPVADVEEKSAIVRCSGRISNTDLIMDFEGHPTCAACNSFFQGRKGCSHACLGFGDCVEVCKYDAIKIVDGLAVIDRAKCVGCGMCARLCPNHLIDIIPASSTVYVGCMSTDKGAFTRKVCKAGCIGCKKCEKVCPEGAVTVVDNMAHIDPAKCTNCGLCAEACPRKVIITDCVGCTAKASA